MNATTGEFGPPPGAGVPQPGRRASYLAPDVLAPRPLIGSARYGATAVQRPGVIPLRPLSVSDIVDAAIKSVRRSPGACLGASALLAGIAVALGILAASAATSGSLLRATGTIDVLNPTLVSLWITTSALALAAWVGHGLIAHVVAQACLGDRPTLAQTWQATRSRLGWCLLAGVASEALWLVWSVATVAVVVMLANVSVGLAVLAEFAFAVATLAAITLAGPRLAMIPSIIVLEKLRPIAATRRAWALSRGNWAKAAAVILSTTLLAGMIGLVFAAPVLIVGLFTPGLVGSAIGIVAYVLPAAAVLPFLAATGTLLYVDARMRREGFDIVLMRAVAAGRRAEARPRGSR